MGMLVAEYVFQPPKQRGRGYNNPSYSFHVINELASKQVSNDAPSRWARISEVFGRLAAFLCQHLFANSQTSGVNPRTSPDAGLDGLSPSVTLRMTIGSGLSEKGTSPLYS